MPKFMLTFMGQQTFFNFLHVHLQYTLKGKFLYKTFKCTETKVIHQTRHASDKIRTAVEILSKILRGPDKNLILNFFNAV